MAIAYVCGDCGSASLSSDATAYWDVAAQEFQYDINQGSEDYCSDCGDSTRGVSVDYDPAVWNVEFEPGDVVVFRDDVMTFDYLPGQEGIPENYKQLTALVAPDDVTVPPLNKWAQSRETVVIRMVTGELMEAWPWQIKKVEVPRESE